MKKRLLGAKQFTSYWKIAIIVFGFLSIIVFLISLSSINRFKLIQNKINEDDVFFNPPSGGQGFSNPNCNYIYNGDLQDCEIEYGQFQFNCQISYLECCDDCSYLSCLLFDCNCDEQKEDCLQQAETMYTSCKCLANNKYCKCKGAGPINVASCVANDAGGTVACSPPPSNYAIN